jgi:gamma-glutamylcyclotransferase (GGCT)/AIG2-like uncharacterized protein YtfP
VAKSLYFAYGSNLCSEQMAVRCPGARFVCSAILPNYSLSFAGHSNGWGGAVATMSRRAGDQVQGVLYEMPRGAINLLDRYEGHPHVYRREQRRVMTSAGAWRNAYVYFLPEASFLARPSLPYLAIIFREYKRRKFDVGPLAVAADMRKKDEQLVLRVVEHLSQRRQPDTEVVQ